MAFEVRAVEGEIMAHTQQVARPLIWHDRTERWPKPLPLEGATCFFLRFAAGIVGVTAEHVVAAYERALAANPNTVCQLRTSSPSEFSPPVDLAGALIARDTARDIATFAVPAALLKEVDGVALDCRGRWPPPAPEPGGSLSLCGYPEALRTQPGVRFVVSEAWGARAVVEHATADEIMISYDPTQVELPTWAPRLTPVGFDMSGCSGGPVLLHVTHNGLHRWHPVALIGKGPKREGKQGTSAEFDMIRLHRIHAIQPDGTITGRSEQAGGWLPGYR